MDNQLLYSSISAAFDAGARIMEIYNDINSDFEVELKSDNSPLTIADRESHAIISKHLEPLGIPILSEEGAHQPYAERSGFDMMWLVDPIDGTKEFINRNGEFTVNIALIKAGIPVLGVIYLPAKGVLYYATAQLGGFVMADVYSLAQFTQSQERLRLLDYQKNRSGHLCRVLASRSHMSDETLAYIEKLRTQYKEVVSLSKGSSIKMCLIADGKADIYPRFSPTMEWDTAAGDAILRSVGGVMVSAVTGKPLQYNKENLTNPHFIAK